MDQPTFYPDPHSLPPEDDARRWGLYVTDCGIAEIPPGADYPHGDEQHPSGHLPSWKEGRTLQDYQLVYITRGEGTFETSQLGRVRIETGDVFMLYPGIWHRFRQLKPVGWHEDWIRFNGDMADRIMGAFFSPDSPVIRVGYDQELLHLIRSVSGLRRQAPPGYPQLMGARTMEVLAQIRSLAMSYRPIDRDMVRKVQQARQYFVQHKEHLIDMDELAKTLGMGYSRFRQVFKEHTGVAPHQYQLDIRMNMARHWLVDSDLPVSEIADMLGFSSVQYFSRLFKRKEGCSPSAYRKR